MIERSEFGQEGPPLNAAPLDHPDDVGCVGGEEKVRRGGMDEREREEEAGSRRPYWTEQVVTRK